VRKLLENEQNHPQHLPIEEATANNILDAMKFKANAIRDYEEEWAIWADATYITGLVTFTI
jgi:hypothetical protein